MLILCWCGSFVAQFGCFIPVFERIDGEAIFGRGEDFAVKSVFLKLFEGFEMILSCTWRSTALGWSNPGVFGCLCSVVLEFLIHIAWFWSSVSSHIGKRGVQNLIWVFLERTGSESTVGESQQKICYWNLGSNLRRNLGSDFRVFRSGLWSLCSSESLRIGGFLGGLCDYWGMFAFTQNLTASFSTSRKFQEVRRFTWLLEEVCKRFPVSCRYFNSLQWLWWRRGWLHRLRSCSYPRHGAKTFTPALELPKFLSGRQTRGVDCLYRTEFLTRVLGFGSSKEAGLWEPPNRAPRTRRIWRTMTWNSRSRDFVSSRYAFIAPYQRLCGLWSKAAEITQCWPGYSENFSSVITPIGPERHCLQL